MFLISVFERAAAAIGYNFISHTFWDKYIEFEESKNESARLLTLLERIIHIPLHQYARYFEKFVPMDFLLKLNLIFFFLDIRRFLSLVP